MLFDRYRKTKRPGDNTSTTQLSNKPQPQKSSSLAGALFRRLPYALTRKPWQQQQQQKRQDSGVSIVIAAPRQSASLPNITRLDTANLKMMGDESPSSLSPLPVVSPQEKCAQGQLLRAESEPKPLMTVSTPVGGGGGLLCKADVNHHIRARRVAKRHSVEHYKPSSHLDDHMPSLQPTKRAKSEKDKRHSYTYGHITDGIDRLTVADLNLPNEVALQLPRLPQRSQSQQLPPSQPKLALPRAHSVSSSMHNKHVDYVPTYRPLSAERLAGMLAAGKQNMVLIDVRSLLEYQKRRIRGSLNVNLPSLLIKRYQRGTMSNFNLENFITTAEGRERYLHRRRQRHQEQEAPPTITTSTPTVTSSILEQKAAEAAAKAKRRSLGTDDTVWVVYDDDMLESQQTSQAWTLLKVLDRATKSHSIPEDGVTGYSSEVYYLRGGFKAFDRDYSDQWIETTCEGEESVDGFMDQDVSDRSNSIVLPRRSVSYTMGSGVNDKSHLHRRTSLFSLDTQAARANNASALARRANRRSQAAAAKQNNNSNNNNNSTHHSVSRPAPENAATTNSNDLHSSSSNMLSVQQQHLAAASSASTSTSSSPLARVVEDDDETMADTISPHTEADFEFVISEIIPGFLFLGPEIETAQQAEQLNQRHIRRVLNMAEECDDKVLEKNFIYRKIAARDTVEMKNIDWVMMEAVCFIGK